MKISSERGVRTTDLQQDLLKGFGLRVIKLKRRSAPPERGIMGKWHRNATRVFQLQVGLRFTLGTDELDKE